MTTLSTLFHESAGRYPGRQALSVDAQDFTYGELRALVQQVAAWLSARCQGAGPRVAILASRSWPAYAGLLAASHVGGTYIPLHPDWPEDRIRQILRAAAPDALIVDDRGLKALSPNLVNSCPPHILAPASDSTVCLDATNLVVWGRDSLRVLVSDLAPVEPGVAQLAYIMFTSGTTGTPKGVKISVGNVATFLSAMQQHFPFEYTDRVSQTFELTFDLSVWSMLAAWSSGASLQVLPAGQLMGPSRYIRERQLTVWLSVPSTIACMRSLRMLTPGAFPTLRYSGFCGEPLPAASVEAWTSAACNSAVANFYGPTEATIACLSAMYSEVPVTTKERGIVAIGKPFRGTKAAVVNASLAFLGPGQPGELALSGQQISSGYLHDDVRTAQRFPTINGEVWYLTGDLAYQDAAGIFHHLGRTDHQIKVLGNRVELEEVETHLREVCRTQAVAALPWPVEAGTAGGIVAFVAGTTASAACIREGMQLRVPRYMVPSRVCVLKDLPLNTSGKTDRNALAALLAGGAA